MTGSPGGHGPVSAVSIAREGLPLRLLYSPYDYRDGGEEMQLEFPSSAGAGDRIPATGQAERTTLPLLAVITGRLGRIDQSATSRRRARLAYSR